MWKKFGLTGMLFATLAVAPLTIAAQDWNNNQRNADSAHRGRTQGSVVTQYNSYNSAHGGYVQSDRDDRGSGRSFAIQDRGRDTRNNGRGRDFRTYAAQRDCNR